MSSKDKTIYERRVYPAGKMIVREGEEGAAAYLLQSGSVRVFSCDENGHEVEFAKLGSGQIFGEMALVYDTPRTASVQSVEDCSVIVITRTTFQEKLTRTDPTIRAIVEMLARRIIDTNNAMTTRKETLEDLMEAARAMYENALVALPRTQQRMFQNAVLPKLEEYLEALRLFQARYEEENKA